MRARARVPRDRRGAAGIARKWVKFPADQTTGVTAGSPPRIATTFRAASTPIAVRVSTVAEPRWGMRTTFSRLEQVGMHLGLPLEHVEPRPGDRAGSEGRGERRLVDDRPSGRVDEKRGRLHPGQRGSIDQVVRLGAERAVERDDVGARQQLLECEMARPELRLDLARRTPAPRVGDLHPECPRPARGRLADLPEPDDPERLALDPRAQHEEHAPRPRRLRPDEPLALTQAPGRHQDECEREIGRRLGQDARRVRHDDAAPSARRDVDVVVAHRGVRHDAKHRAGSIEERVVDPVVEQRDHALRAGHRLVQLADLERAVVRARPRRPPPPREARSPARGSAS